MPDQGGFSTRKVGGTTLTLFGIGLPLLQWGLEARGVQLSPAFGTVLLILAAALFLAGLGLLGWHSIKAAWLWLRRVRVGLAPPDAELRKAKEAQKRLFSEFKQAHRERGIYSEANERLRTKLREVEQERDALQKEYEELVVKYEQLASLFVGEQQLKQEAHNLSEGLFELAKTRKGRSDTLRRFLDTAVKENKVEEEVKGISQEKSQWDAQTNYLYQRHYEPKVGALLDAAERRGWCNAEKRKEIESIFGDSTIPPADRIAQGAARLGEFGRRIL